MEADMLVNLIKEREETLEAALVVSSQIDRVKEDLLKKLKSDIEIILKTTNSSLIMEWRLNRWTKHSDIAFSKQTWANYKISFGSELTELQEFYYGIAKVDEKKKDIRSIRAYLGDGNNDGWFPWWKNFDPPLLDWKTSVEPWVAMLTDSMARELVKKAEELSAGLEKCAAEQNIAL